MVIKMKYKLYGDGVHDDTDALQELLDNERMIHLPVPKDKYIISRSLVIGSDTVLKLDENTVIKLADGSDCVMLRNKNRYTQDKNITIIGGIWDMNNKNQSPNPLWVMEQSNETKDYGFVTEDKEYTDVYFGSMMRFSHVNNFTFKNAVFKDPINFCLQMANIHYFTIENITFDFNLGNPVPVNMDGIHIDGGCSNGVLRNLKGTCYDDLVALNADDSGAWDTIESIEIDGVFAENCHSAVRLLSTGSPVRNINISNVFGTYYQYVIGITHFYFERMTTGIFENISLNHIYASKALRPDYLMKSGAPYAPIHVDRKLSINKLSICDLNRIEKNISVEYILVDEGTTIKNMSVRDLYQENHTGGQCPVLKNDGVIESLYTCNVYADKDDIFTGSGTIKQKCII